MLRAPAHPGEHQATLAAVLAGCLVALGGLDAGLPDELALPRVEAAPSAEAGYPLVLPHTVQRGFPGCAVVHGLVGGAAELHALGSAFPDSSIAVASRWGGFRDVLVCPR